jgi:hypothetical protein
MNEKERTIAERAKYWAQARKEAEEKVKRTYEEWLEARKEEERAKAMFEMFTRRRA